MFAPDERQVRIAEAIAADGVKPREQRIGLIPAMLTVVQPEIDALKVELEEDAAIMRALRRQRDKAEAERDKALAALQEVREAQSLGEALAAVAKHDGLTAEVPVESNAPSGLRGLLEHVGIDVAGRVITVDGVPIDDVGATAVSSDHPDRCARCLCSDCGGRLDEHTETSCGCSACEHSPSLACSLADFLPDMRIGFIAEQLGPLLSVWLGEKQQRRCAVVAHAAHHALYDYDQKENER